MNHAGIELKKTHDGSYTLFNPNLNETYHSIHGARQESEHVFIEHGLKLMWDGSPLRILEIGVGTGLNLWLTALHSRKHHLQIEYVGLEPYPVASEILEDYIQANTKSDELRALWLDLMSKSEGSVDQMKYQIMEETLLSLESVQPFDLIYFDAFAPNKQPEMWEKEVFQKLYNLSAKDALLTTYCAQGQFKRNLANAGFEVSNLPGPPGKREMTHGRKL